MQIQQQQRLSSQQTNKETEKDFEDIDSCYSRCSITAKCPSPNKQTKKQVKKQPKRF